VIDFRALEMVAHANLDEQFLRATSPSLSSVERLWPIMPESCGSQPEFDAITAPLVGATLPQREDDPELRCFALAYFFEAPVRAFARSFGRERSIP